MEFRSDFLYLVVGDIESMEKNISFAINDSDWSDWLMQITSHCGAPSPVVRVQFDQNE